MRWILILVAIAVSGILCWSNWQPITLHFLGNSSQAALFSFSLPLAIWLLLFTLAGFLSSFFIQVLSRLFSSSSSSRRPRQGNATPPPQPRGVSPNSERDWEQQLPNEWDIEAPPQEPTQTRNYAPPTSKNPDPPLQDRFQADFPIENSSDVPSTETEVAASQPPKKVTREGSVYTYTYREKGDRPSPPTANATDQVYDANYRVIRPPQPNQPPADADYSDEDEEDWI